MNHEKQSNEKRWQAVIRKKCMQHDPRCEVEGKRHAGSGAPKLAGDAGHRQARDWEERFVVDMCISVM